MNIEIITNDDSDSTDLISNNSSNPKVKVVNKSKLETIPMKDKCTVFENPHAEDKVYYEDRPEKCIETIQNYYIFKFDENGDPLILLGPDCNYIC